MNLKLNDARVFKILLTVLIYMLVLSPLYFFSSKIEGFIDALGLNQFKGSFIGEYYPYILIAFFALLILGILIFIMNKVAVNRPSVRTSTQLSIQPSKSVDAITVSIKSMEITSSYEQYLNYEGYFGASLLPGFRSGKGLKKAAALLYFIVSLLPLLEGNEMITAVLISIPFIVYEVHGLVSKHSRKVDFKLKLLILICFTAIFAFSSFMTYMDIETGNFRSDTTVKVICSVPDILEKVHIKVDPISFYDAAASLGKDNSLPYIKKGSYYEKAGRKKKAEESYLSSIPKGADNYEIYYALGRLYLKQDDKARALEMFKTSQSRNRKYSPAFKEGAKLLLEGSDLDKADKMNDKALKIDENDIEAYELKAKIMLAQKNYKDAITAYTRAIRIKPGRAELYSEKAYALIAAKRMDEALFNIDKALKLRPDSADNIFVKGSIEMVQNSFDGAVESFKRSLQLKPDLLLARGWLALAYLKKGDSKTAKEEIEKAMKNGDGIPLLHFVRAYILSRTQSYDEALIEINKAISTDGKQADFYGLKCEILLKKGDSSAAHEQVLAALAADADNDFANYAKGRYLLSINDYKDALDAFDKAIAINPYLARAYAGKAIAASMLGDKDTADNNLYVAMNMETNDYYGFYAKAVINYNQKRFMGALTALNKAIEINGQDAELTALKMKVTAAASSQALQQAPANAALANAKAAIPQQPKAPAANTPKPATTTVSAANTAAAPNTAASNAAAVKPAPAQAQPAAPASNTQTANPTPATSQPAH